MQDMIAFERKNNWRAQMTIERAVYFELCSECGCHGRIVCADGSISREFGTVIDGLKELESLECFGKVAKDEALKIKRQILQSDLGMDCLNMEKILRTFRGTELAERFFKNYQSREKRSHSHRTLH